MTQRRSTLSSESSNESPTTSNRNQNRSEVVENKARPVFNSLEDLGKIECPISDCLKDFKEGALLAHLKTEHSDIAIHSLHVGESCQVSFKYSDLPFREIVCVGVLLFKENDEEPESNVECSSNDANAPQEESSDLPLMILASRTCWSAVLDDTFFASKKKRGRKDESKHNLVVWVAGSVTAKTCLNIRMNVENAEQDFKKINVLTCRRLSLSQNPGKFVMVGTNYLRLTKDEIDVLTEDTNGEVTLIITIDRPNA